MKNNKGFSLLEMIIVIAILAVVASVSFVGLGYLYTTNIKSSVKKINSSLLKTQSYTTAKSIGGRDVGMRIKVDTQGNYCVEYLGITEQADEVIGKKNLTVKCYKSDGSVQQVTSSSPVDIYFDRATGGLLPVAEGGSTYWSKIEITTNGANQCTVTISKVTGKTEMTFFESATAVPTPSP